jgi:hypothetical protein
MSRCGSRARPGSSESATAVRTSTHLPDGPEQHERDARFADEDPLSANGWIYAYDPDACP